MMNFNAAAGEIFVGSAYEESFVILNQGTTDLHIRGAAFKGDNLGQLELSFAADGVIAADSIRQGSIRLTPQERGRFRCTLVIESDDPDEGELRIPLIPDVATPPMATVDPDSLDYELPTGAVEQSMIDVNNE